eukprot:sb/3479113/
MENSDIKDVHLVILSQTGSDNVHTGILISYLDLSNVEACRQNLHKVVLDVPFASCLQLLTIRRIWHSRRVRAVVRVWLGFGLRVSVSAIDSLSDAV